MTISEIKKINRFTTLPILLDLLQRKKLTLLNPKLWEDKNDSEIILEYKKRKGIKNLFAVCFSCNDETVHHWKTFSHGPSGCLIEFNAKKLMAIFEQYGLTHGLVQYKKLSDIEKRGATIEMNKIPFTKRWPYRCEEEYRVIYETNDDMDFFEIEIPLNVIQKITISQQMPKQIYQTIKDYLKSVSKNPESKINRSTLYENQRWIKRFQKL
jgi:hypothetical protein